MFIAGRGVGFVDQLMIGAGVPAVVCSFWSNGMRLAEVQWFGLGVVGVLFAAARVSGQVVPWDVYDDPLSDSVCDVVNVANGELVVLSSTGELVLVTGSDVILVDTFVDLDGNVFYLEEPAGIIDFATDDDGLRSLWWLSLNGAVVHVDGFTGEPSVTDTFPSEYSDVPCDACEFWDDPSVCEEPPPDGDGDGFPVPISLCGADSSASMAMTGLGLALMAVRRRRLG